MHASAYGHVGAVGAEAGAALAAGCFFGAAAGFFAAGADFFAVPVFFLDDEVAMLYNVLSENQRQNHRQCARAPTVVGKRAETALRRQALDKADGRDARDHRHEHAGQIRRQE